MVTKMQFYNEIFGKIKELMIFRLFQQGKPYRIRSGVVKFDQRLRLYQPDEH